MADWARRHPLTTYYVLAVAISTGLALLLNVSLVFGLLALFGPAIAAFLVARLVAGRPGVRTIWARTRRWRVSPRYYLAAIGLPLVAYAVGLAAYVLAGNEAPTLPGAITIVGLVLFVLVIGEEIGWRGFMLPTLLRRMSPLLASGVTGGLWALWHAPLYFLPGMPSYGDPYLAFVLWIVPLSFVMTWLWIRTRSVIIATVAHGSANVVSGLVLPLDDPGPRYVFSGIGFAVVAVVLVVVARREFLASPPPLPAADTGIVEPAWSKPFPPDRPRSAVAIALSTAAHSSSPAGGTASIDHGYLLSALSSSVGPSPTLADRASRPRGPRPLRLRDLDRRPRSTVGRFGDTRDGTDAPG
jgi:membrane protease YdiL (CAAX protease family)